MPEWRLLAAFGTICVIQTFLDFTPAGPWDSRSFSRGVIGLIGLVSIYISGLDLHSNEKG